MKKLFTLFALLGAIFFAQQVSAAEYDLWINGERITDSNKNQITGSFGNGSVTGGTITFNSSTYTLNIPAGVTITAGNSSAIEVAKMNLTIKIGSGTVNIYAKNKDCNGIRMTTEGNYTCTIEGNNTTSNISVSTLNITAGQNKSAFHIHKKCTGIVKNVYIYTSNSSNAKYGIDGSDGSSGETLKVQGNSQLLLNAQNYSIGDINYLTLSDHDFYISGSDWTDKTGIVFKDRYVKNNSGNDAFTCWIRPIGTKYEVSIAGHDLNNLNYSYMASRLRVLGILTSAASTLSYAPSSKTLTLNGATLKTPLDGIYNSGNDGMIISCSGTNNITSTASSTTYCGIDIRKATTIQGTGTLNITSNNSTGIQFGASTASTLTISGGLTLNVNGVNGISGATADTHNNKLIFNNVSANIKASKYCVYRFNNGIEVKDCDVVTPIGHHVKYSTNTDAKGYYIGSATSYSYNTTVVIKNKGTDYPVSLAGRRLNTNNYQNISWPGVSGTVTYSPSLAQLTLNDATITNYNGYGIETWSDFLTLNLIGDNKVYSSGIALDVNSTNSFVSGEGTLTLNSTGAAGTRIYRGNTTLNISCKQFVSEGKTFGIHSFNGNSGLKLIKRTNSNGPTTEYAFIGETASIDNLSELTYDDMDFYSWSGDAFQGTYGAYWDASKKGVYYNGGTTKATKRVSIRPITQKYNIWIAGKQLNNCNCNYPGSPYITSGGRGAVRYVPSENTLYLYGPTITYNNGYAITSSQENLTINVNGSSTLTATDATFYMMGLSKNPTITGSSKLNIKPKGGGGIYLFDASTLTFKDADVYISGSIAGREDAKGKVVITNSEVTVGGNFSNITSVTPAKAGVSSGGTYLIYPQGGYFDATAGYVKNASGNKVSTVIYGKPVSYGLTIDNIAVTNANNTDPTGDGSFSYDPNTKTLSVKKSYTGKSNYQSIINKDIEGLVIKFTGSYTLISPNASCIRTEKNMTIQSSNASNIITLMCNNDSGDGIGVYADNKTLTLDNVKMNITAPFGLYSSSNNKLVIKKSELTIMSTKGKRCIGAFAGGVELSECGIYSPTGGKFAGGTAVDKNGTVITTSLIINQQGTGIEAVVADDFDGTEVEGVDNAEGIYDLNGRRLNELQRGVNIVRRRDGSTVKVVKK